MPLVNTNPRQTSATLILWIKSLKYIRVNLWQNKHNNSQIDCGECDRFNYKVWWAIKTTNSFHEIWKFWSGAQSQEISCLCPPSRPGILYESFRHADPKRYSRVAKHHWNGMWTWSKRHILDFLTSFLFFLNTSFLKLVNKEIFTLMALLHKYNIKRRDMESSCKYKNFFYNNIWRSQHDLQ